MPESILTKVKNDPATKELMGNLGGYVSAQVGNKAHGLVEKAAGGGRKGEAVAEVVDSKMQGDGKLKTLGKGIKAFFKGGSGAAKRPTNITDDFMIGMPVAEVYNQWVQWEKFAGFMKGVEQVTQDDDHVTSNWKAKIFLNKRSWKSTVVEQSPEERIKWKTEGNKGTIDGLLSFHPLGDRLTMVIYVLEYRPKGFFEWWGNRWRTVGRRARLDMKHFKRHLMMQGGADPDAWRGSVIDGEAHEEEEVNAQREQEEQDNAEQDQEQDGGEQDVDQSQGEAAADDQAEADEEDEDESTEEDEDEPAEDEQDEEPAAEADSGDQQEEEGSDDSEEESASEEEPASEEQPARAPRRSRRQQSSEE